MKRTATSVGTLLVIVLAACSAGTDQGASGAPFAATPTGAPATIGVPATTDSPAADASETASATAVVEADALLAVLLTDVRSGESFTLGELAASDGPVLLEPMAVWCTTCLSQQRQIVEAHAEGDFTSVSLDVDLSETPEQLAEFADREGFDWRFAMADADLYRLLQERFGVAVTNPPSTPLIVVDADGTVRPLEFGRGVRGAGDLLAEIGAG